MKEYLARKRKTSSTFSAGMFISDAISTAEIERGYRCSKMRRIVFISTCSSALSLYIIQSLSALDSLFLVWVFKGNATHDTDLKFLPQDLIPFYASTNCEK